MKVQLFKKSNNLPNPKKDKNFLRNDVWCQNAEVFIDLKMASSPNLLKLEYVKMQIQSRLKKVSKLLRTCFKNFENAKT